MINFRPMGDKILVRPIERVKSSIIHVIMDEKDNQGTVIAVGPGKNTTKGREPMPISVGQFVRFGTMGRDSKEEYLKYPEHYIDGVRYLILSWQDVAWAEESENV